ncbi:hemolysin family protein [Dictyobacter arantiisoli]|uniref:Membrane protein n=1 Tax=Dictyobacter arantiisoli TaxID=2014874 RepID=A0A5A5TF54_9CHLR|nr:hemolysin family protein [Dictyobacter arantiisoli]GCF09703.1 membrane protein [Dictyobacter arantiisoli]
MDVSSIVGLIAVFALVGANGFFVAGEFALVKVRATRVEQLVTEGNKTAQVVRAQVQHLDTFIAATQLGITLASLALGWIGEPSLAHLIEPLFLWLGGVAAEAITHTIAVIISFLLITIFHIVLGELVPKSIALQRAEGTALFVARPLYIFSRLFRPCIMMMNGVGNFVVRSLGLEVTSEHAAVHSVEELEMLVAQSREAGILQQQEEVLLRHVFDFSDKTAQQIMVPRSEVVAVPITITRETLIQTFSREGYTRLPVYEDSLDNIIGLAHIKDIFQSHSTQQAQNFSLRTMLRPVLYVTETSALDIILGQIRNKRIHMAVVIDEYGTTAGIITLEDIIEELVGEVHDEFDTSEQGVRHEIEYLPDGSISVDGLMALSSFADQFGKNTDNIEKIHANTLAGYIFEKLDRLPSLGDSVLFDNYRLRVEEMDGRRIARVKVTRAQPEDNKEPLLVVKTRKRRTSTGKPARS